MQNVQPQSTYSHTFIVFFRANILQDFLSLISIPEVKLISNIKEKIIMTDYSLIRVYNMMKTALWVLTWKLFLQY